MRGTAQSMKMLRPRTQKEALRLYAKNPEAVPLAGGTDFMVLWNMGRLDGKTIIDLSALTRWTRIRERREGWWIGALATHAQVQEHPKFPRVFPLLRDACATVGGEQIQNRGTLGGNIANASPAGDTFPPLAVYEAVVHTVSAKGTRRIPFRDFFRGVKKTALAPSELIEGILIPHPRRASRQLFRKVGTRAAQAISKTSAAGLLWLERDGSVKELRFACGSVAPTVRRLSAVEAFVSGKKLSRALIREACGLIGADISPIDDIRSTRDYRLEVSQNILRSFLEG